MQRWLDKLQITENGSFPQKISINMEMFRAKKNIRK